MIENKTCVLYLYQSEGDLSLWKRRRRWKKWNNENRNDAQHLIFKFCKSVWDILVHGIVLWWCSESSKVNFYPPLQWSEIEPAHNFAAFKTGEPFKRVINRDNLFDMFCQGKLLWGKRTASVKLFKVKYLLFSIWKIIEIDNILHLAKFSPNLPDISALGGGMLSQLKNCSLQRRVNRESQ